MLMRTPTPSPESDALSPGLRPSVMYAAVRRRDLAFVGQFVVGVRTTGVFCRPGCPARIPARANCEFFASADAAAARGLRACRRCKPLETPPPAPRWALRVIDWFANTAGFDLDGTALPIRDIHPSTVSRYFRRRLGAPLQTLIRTRRAGAALRALQEGESMNTALALSGFDSESGLRKAIGDLWHNGPARAVAIGQAPLVARWVATPLGVMLAVACDEGLCQLDFVDARSRARNTRLVSTRLRRPLTAGDHPHIASIERELEEHFAGTRRRFETPLRIAGTPFQERVWQAVLSIPFGETRSYAHLARSIGMPSCVRAVAAANAANPLAIVVPCHRVIGSDGSGTGYAGGLWRKHRLLAAECKSGAGLPG